MPNTKRPRVAAIGLDEDQIESIVPLCGELRDHNTLPLYLRQYNWTETDAVVAAALKHHEVDVGAHLLTVGPAEFFWSDASGYNPGGRKIRHEADTGVGNTERELAISDECPEVYRPLATALSKQLERTPDPPAVIRTSRRGGRALVETTSGHPVALRLAIPGRPATEARSASSGSLALLLPDGADLAAWCRAFLSDIHDYDPARVPVAPPRLSQPSDWFAPDERHLAACIAKVDAELDLLHAKRDELEVELGAAGQRAEEGVRRILWLDGDELVEAARGILGELGFTVRDMDAELEPRQQKREDLRLTLSDKSGWEAIVEVKGYTNSTRTSDSRQVREQRERYIKEENGEPDLTLWLCNPYRELDPSSRPTPDQNVSEAAEIVGAVHALTTDLYRQWALVAAGELDAEAVVQSLMDAEPGLWVPPAVAPAG